MKKIKRLSFIFLALFIALGCFSKIYGVDNINVTTIKQGDVIYYDNSYTKWDNVKIYIFNKSGDHVFNWKDDKGQMQKIGNTDIWKFTVTSDIDVTSKNYDEVIFLKADQSRNEDQTIDLGYISSYFAYVSEGVNTEREYKQMGYWYLYDKTELKELLEECKKYEEKYYTSDSWAKFKTSMDDAQDVLDGEQKLESVNEDGSGGYKCDYFYKLEELQKANDELVIDKEVLNKKIKDANEKLKNADKYTEDSIDNLKNAIDKAQDKYDDDALELDELKEELTKLDDAINNLKPNKDKLKEKLDEVNGIIDNKDLKYYTDDSVNALKDKVNRGNEVYKNDEATLEEVENATNDLDGGIKGLELNKKMLEDLLNSTKDTDFDKYTDETVTALKSAINSAEELLKNGDITLDKFKNTLENLNTALNGLIEKQGEVVTNNTQTPNTGSNILIAIILLSVGSIVLLITFIYTKKAQKNN